MSAAVVLIVAVALAFDFFNGFHDAANSIATVVSTRVLSPRAAVAWAAFFNFAAFVIFGTAVAATIAKDVVKPEVLTNEVIFAGLLGAIAWDVITWFFGLPTSSSHALVGGMSGAAVASSGWHSLITSGLQKIAVFIVLSPIVGFLLGFTLMVIVFWAFHRYRKVDKLNRGFRRMQLVSAAAFSLGHGANDAQKTMGVMTLALIAAHPGRAFSVPTWVIVSAAMAMAAGTYAGGWRIIRTLGQRIAKLDPPQGFAAEAATASILWYAAHVGYPVSTTHTISGSVLGAGATTRLSAVRWGVAGNIVVAWLLTMPCAALAGAAVELLTRAPGGVALDTVLVTAIAAAAFWARTSRSRAAARENAALTVAA
jgi:inorganic phosphate transporter, PiT family